MSESTRAGREPIEAIIIDQDRCTELWSIGACEAGKNNTVFNSTDFNSADWVIGDLSITPNQSGDPFGGSEAIEFEYIATTSHVEQTEDLQDTPFEVRWHTLYAKTTSAIDRVILKAAATGGETQVNVDLTDGSINFQEHFDSVIITDIGSGWYKIDASINAENIVGGLLQIQFLDGAGAPSANDTALIYGLQVTNTSTQEYLPTTGEAKIAPSDKRCFGTRATCQSPVSYDRGTLPLNFVKPASSAPRDDYYIPSLRKVSIGAAKLNPSAANRSSSALGRRATISASFKDHPHNDKLVDQYRDTRDYDPLERSTFWAKWRARNPYYMHRFITHVSGYLVGGEIVDAIERSFVITGFNGPDSAGNVTIQGKDILTLAEDVKAQVPNISTGSLLAEIFIGDSTATLTPSGIGNIEYPASGTLRIESEVATYTRAGDIITFVSRGIDGTTEDDHDDGSVVQDCYVAVAQKPQDILYDFFTNNANIPAIYLDKAGWDAEQLSYLPNLYSTVIAEPTGLSKIVAEMCQQMYFTIWWDERANLVRMRAVRSAEDDTIYPLDDNSNLIGNSVSWVDLADELITQVWVYYGQIDPTQKIDEAANFAVLEKTADPDVESFDKLGLRKIQKIFSRWIDVLDAGAAADLGTSILARYSNVPREVKFSVDAKDGAMWLGDFATLTNRNNVDQFGTPKPANIQIYEASEPKTGTVFSYVAQEFIASIGVDVSDSITLIVSANVLNLDLRKWYEDRRGVPVGTEKIIFVIRDGVSIGGDSAGGGVNILQADRDTGNDAYDAGTSNIGGVTIGDVNILQRAGIVSPRTTAKGAVYAGGAETANWEIREYPLSIALKTGSWPAGVELNLVVESGASIPSEGGNGSSHSFESVLGGTIGNATVDGGDGGHALEITYPINITNLGVIGGGGGGGGNLSFDSSLGGTMRQARGGGGAGLNFSLVASNIFTGPVIPVSRSDSSGGVILEGGAGGTAFAQVNGGFGSSQPFGNDIYWNNYPDNEGGKGGDLGQDGQDAIFALNSNTGGLSIDTNGQGGLAGNAVNVGKNLITWINKGDVRGAENV